MFVAKQTESPQDTDHADTRFISDDNGRQTESDRNTSIRQCHTAVPSKPLCGSDPLIVRTPPFQNGCSRCQYPR